jgi:phosphonate transport system substrate-binding protein
MKTAFQRQSTLALLIGLVAASCLSAASGARGQDNGKGEIKTISVGLVSEINRSGVEDNFRDLARYLGRRLSSPTAIEGRVVVASTPFQMAKLLEQRKVDLYLESPYPTYVINYVHGAGRLLLRRWKGGVPEYHSLIFARRDQGINRLEDLRGNAIAFEDPSSTSGYFLPRFFLVRAGFKLIEGARFDPHASKVEVRYVFAYSQDKLLDWVLTHRVNAGAFSSDDHAALDNQKKAEIVVLAQTERLPRHLVSVRRDLAPELAGRIEKIFLGMHEDEEGRRILSRTDGTTKFDLLPGGDAAMRRRLLDTFFSEKK